MTLACTLTSAELRARREQVAALAERSLRSRDGHRLVFDPAAEPALRELVALEAECCPFLTLDLRRDGDALALTVTGPDEAAPIIAELFSGGGGPPWPGRAAAPADAGAPYWRHRLRARP